MVRPAFLILASSVLLSCGCISMHDRECASSCPSGGWFSRFRLASRTTSAPCECEGAMPVAGGDVVVPPTAMMPPGAYPTPGPAIMTNPPAAAQPPRIVPVPQQAVPMPYTPQ